MDYQIVLMALFAGLLASVGGDETRKQEDSMEANLKELRVIMLMLALIPPVGFLILISGSYSYAEGESESRSIGPWWNDDDLDGSGELGQKPINQLQKQYQSPATLLEASKHVRQEAPNSKENRRHRGKIPLIDNHSKVLHLVLPTSNVRIPLEWTHWENTETSIKRSEESQETNKRDLIMAQEADDSGYSRSQESSSPENLLGQHRKLQTKKNPVNGSEESQDDSGESRGYQISRHVRRNFVNSSQFKDNEKRIQHFPNPGQPMSVRYDTRNVPPQPGQHVQQKGNSQNAKEISISVSENSQETIERNEHRVRRAHHFQDSERQHNERNEAGPGLIRAGGNIRFIDQEKRIQHVPNSTQPTSTPHDSTGWKKNIIGNNEKPVQDFGFLEQRSQPKYQENLETPNLPSGEQTMKPYNLIANLEVDSKPNLPRANEETPPQQLKVLRQATQEDPQDQRRSKQKGSVPAIAKGPQKKGSNTLMNGTVNGFESTTVQEQRTYTKPKKPTHSNQQNFNPEQLIPSNKKASQASALEEQITYTTKPTTLNHENTNPGDLTEKVILSDNKVSQHATAVEERKTGTTKRTNSNQENSKPGDITGKLILSNKNDSQNESTLTKLRKCPAKPRNSKQENSNAAMINGLFDGTKDKYKEAVRPAVSAVKELAGQFSQIIQATKKALNGASHSRGVKTKTVKLWQKRIRSLINGFLNTVKGVVVDTMSPALNTVKELSHVLTKKLTKTNSGRMNGKDGLGHNSLSKNVSQNKLTRIKTRSLGFSGTRVVPKTSEKSMEKPLRSLINGFLNTVSETAVDVMRPAVSAVRKLAKQLVTKNMSIRMKNSNLHHNGSQKAPLASTAPVPKTRKTKEDPLQSLIIGFTNAVKDAAVDVLRPAGSTVQQMTKKSVTKKKETPRKSTRRKLQHGFGQKGSMYSSTKKPSPLRLRSPINGRGPIFMTTEKPWENPLKSLINGFLNTVRDTAADVLAPVKKLTHKFATKEPLMQDKTTQIKKRHAQRSSGQKTPTSTTTVNPKESRIRTLTNGFLDNVSNTAAETLFGKWPKNPAETGPSNSSSNHQDDAKGKMSSQNTTETPSDVSH